MKIIHHPCIDIQLEPLGLRLAPAHRCRSDPVRSASASLHSYGPVALHNLRHTVRRRTALGISFQIAAFWPCGLPDEDDTTRPPGQTCQSDRSGTGGLPAGGVLAEADDLFDRRVYGLSGASRIFMIIRTEAL